MPAGMEQRVSLVTLGVADVGRARVFYEALGWTTRAEPGEDVVFFQAGGMIVGDADPHGARTIATHAEDAPECLREWSSG